MDKITFCIPSKNNLRYLKWCIPSIRQNASRSDHDIIVFVDKDTDGTINWLKENSDRLNVKYIINPDINNTLYGIGRAYDACIHEAKTEICVVFHADMYLCKDADINMFKHLNENSVVCATRIEPPLHPPGLEKIVMDFGMWPEENITDGFKEHELNEFVLHSSKQFENKSTNGCFAPWMIYKSKLIDIGGHDPILKSAREDSDIFNRFVLNGMNLIQSRDSFVYHLTCRGGQFEHGVLTTNHSEKSLEWQKLMQQSTWDYIRKWGRFVEHDEYMMPIIRPHYDIGVVINNGDDVDVIKMIEPWVSTLYLNDKNLSEKLISEIQLDSSFDIKNKIIYLENDTSDNIKNDVVVYVDLTTFGQNDFNIITSLSDIITSQSNTGNYFIENIKVFIKRIFDINKQKIIILK